MRLHRVNVQIFLTYLKVSVTFSNSVVNICNISCGVNTNKKQKTRIDYITLIGIIYLQMFYLNIFHMLLKMQARDADINVDKDNSNIWYIMF